MTVTSRIRGRDLDRAVGTDQRARIVRMAKDRTTAAEKIVGAGIVDRLGAKEITEMMKKVSENKNIYV